MQTGLLNSTETFLVHICDCISKDASDNTANIFNKFPYSNTYSKRIDISIRSEPGSIDICGGNKKRFVVNFYSKYFSKEPKSFDTSDKRKEWLLSCLDLLLEYMETKNIKNKSIAINSILYNNDPNDYNAIFIDFCKKKDIKVVVYKNY